MSRATLLAVTTVLMVVVGAAAPAGAAPTVSISSASRSGAVATVTGTAGFDPLTDEVSVGGVKTAGPGGGSAVGAGAGLGLVDATIQPLQNNSGLRFTWILDAMPAQVPPEGVRYNWAFGIGSGCPSDAANATCSHYQLQAKRTNVASITTLEDPMGHVQQAAAQKNFFQLRGACVTNYFGTPVAVAGCYHLAWLNGGFDVENKKVWVDLPFETKDQINRIVAANFKPGVVLVPIKSAGMGIAASLQAVISNTDVSQYINDWIPYAIGGVVQLGAGTASADPENVTYNATATLTGTAFTGSVGGLTTSKNTVFVRACSGMECSYTQITP